MARRKKKEWHRGMRIEHALDLNSDRYIYPDWHPINLNTLDEWHQRDKGQTEVVIAVEELAEAV